MPLDYDIEEFASAEAFRQWLQNNHASVDGLWLKLYKKAAKVTAITYDEALDEALCYGWIDGQKKAGDDQYFLQKFTPRRKRSLWSKRNVEYIERLRAGGRMMPSGLAEVAQAQADGRWQAAYDKPSSMVEPDYFTEALANNPVARDFYATLNKTNKYAVIWRLQTAGSEATRQRRLAKLLGMLEAKQKLH